MPDNRFTLHVDLDSTANDFVLGFRHFLQFHRPHWLTRDIGDLLQRTRFDGHESYDFWREWLTEDEFARLLSEDAYELFLRLPSYQGFCSGTRELHEAGAKLVAVTDARVPFSGEVCHNQRRAKLEWVGKQAPWFDEVRFVHDPDQRAHGADLVVDDKLANLVAASDVNVWTVAKRQPWNEIWGHPLDSDEAAIGVSDFSAVSWRQITDLALGLNRNFQVYGGRS